MVMVWSIIGWGRHRSNYFDSCHTILHLGSASVRFWIWSSITTVWPLSFNRTSTQAYPAWHNWRCFHQDAHALITQSHAYAHGSCDSYELMHHHWFWVPHQVLVIWAHEHVLRRVTDLDYSSNSCPYCQLWWSSGQDCLPRSNTVGPVCKCSCHLTLVFQVWPAVIPNLTMCKDNNDWKTLCHDLIWTHTWTGMYTTSWF